MENPEKNPRSRVKRQHKLNPLKASGSGIEPGSHWWEASALSTTPSLQHRIESLGSFSKDDGYSNENVSPKYKFKRCRKYFTINPSCSHCTIQANYPVNGWVRTVLKSKLKMTFSLLYAYVVVKT